LQRKFSNFDLGNLVNGWSEDPVELRPFDFHFTKERIINTWKAVGFLPMTGYAMRDPKVRYLLMLQTVWIFFMQIIVSQWKR
jgi:hypothetical protein